MKKYLVILIASLLVIFSSTSSFALTKLYETSESQVINSGTNLTKYKRLTDKGWLSINIIDVDLNDDNTTVSVLNSANGLQTFQNVKTMLTNEKNCIAAINADFFTGKTSKGNSIGMTIKDGKMLTSAYSENEVKDVFASFVLDEDNNVLFDYFSNKITLKNLKNDECILIAEINKWSSNYEYPVLYTKEWGEYSLGSTPELVLTELVVKNNKVAEVRYNEPAVEIPENGYVISTLGKTAEVISNSYKVGSKVELNIEVDFDIEKVKTAVSGGTLLVKNGTVATFTHNISGSNPRTAIGVSKDGETLYLITVDGRQATSIGVSQTELAEILIEKGIYTAMNLDGGGSTTMVVKELGDTLPTVENSPSDGSLRNVTNSIAILNTEKSGKLDKLLIEVDDVNVFVNCEKELKVKGYDKYYNPVEINSDKIEWTFSGVNATVKNNVLTAGNEAGNVKVTASIGKATGTISLDVLSQPNELTISPKKATIGEGGSVSFKISGQNKNGYFADLKNNEVEWKVVEGNGTIKNGVFTANSTGDYIISVTAGKATSYALVTVSSNVSKIANNFENENFIFKSYPEEVIGSVKLASDEVYAGSSSAKLDYDFTKTTKTRAAYLRFNEPVKLESNVESISVMAYSTASTSDQIKAKVTDANGNVQYLLLCKGLESSGWKELEVSLKGVAMPATLTDIYVAQDDASALTAGSVYFDNLSLMTNSTAENSETVLPKDIKGADALNVKTDLKLENAFRIAILPTLQDEKILLDNLKNKKIINTANKYSSVAVFAENCTSMLLGEITKEKINPSGYSVKNYDGTTIITLDISAGGIRATNSNQWLNLQSDIKNANKNILIVMNGNLESFQDADEKQLFIDVLCELRKSTSKNIWVVQTGDNTDYSMKRGVKYLSISNTQSAETNLETIQNSNYILITVDSGKMTYEIKNIYEK